LCLSLLALGIKPNALMVIPSHRPLHSRRHGQWRKEGGRTTGTPQQSPHLEFQGEPERHDSLQKRYSLYSHMLVAEWFEGQKLAVGASSPLQAVHHCSQFRVVFLFLPSVWLFLVTMISLKCLVIKLLERSEGEKLCWLIKINPTLNYLSHKEYCCCCQFPGTHM
jgi:hypothetical protein